ncbi:carbohydrate ABC transporter permease [Paenibacillus sp. GCM10027626]|uniref:carbohydrate ABC transporter permease n=1 Tax=Paenibacillus sp. GCM10027626 TaxID=3273411 RepID=UPI003642AE1C
MKFRLRKQKKINRSRFVDFLLMALLFTVGAFMVLPLLFVISNAFKPLDEVFLYPPKFFVRHPTLNNFVDLYHLLSASWIPFTRYLFNTFFITAAGTAGHIFIASMAAYPLAKRKFPGKNILFSIVVMSLMFSTQVTAIPNFMTMSWLNLIDTYWAIIVPAFGMSLGLYLMKQFMEQIPDALLEAAQLDGCSEFRIYWSIVMPNVKPAWLTLTIFSFQSLWMISNEGASPGRLYLYSEQLKTIDYAMGQILAGGIARVGPSMAATLILISVPILIFVFAQSRIIETMSTSGMKE